MVNRVQTGRQSRNTICRAKIRSTSIVREEIESSGIWTPKSKLSVYLLFGISTLAVGVGIIALRQYTLSRIDAAKGWVATPCVIERAQHEWGDQGERFIAIEYRYQFDGKTYRSDQLDILPGSMGDDGPWEERLLAACPEGAKVTCFVDPANPDDAVLDREHGAQGAGNLRLMAFPFLVIAACFLFAAVNFVASSTVGLRRTSYVADSLAAPPRRLNVGLTLAVLFTTPRQVQLAWAFLMGFAIVFTMLEGPAALRDLWPSHQRHASGEVTRVEGLDQYEFYQQVYEYEFRYEIDGHNQTGKSHTVGQRYEVGDVVPVAVDPDGSGAARIVGERRRSIPIWVTAIPGVVLLLLACGIVGNYVFNLRMLKLVRNGRVAIGTKKIPSSEAVDPSNVKQARAALSRYQFDLDGETHLVDPRSWADGEDEAVPVLYDPSRPAWNLGLDERRTSMLNGRRSPWPVCLQGMFVPVACVMALIWFWGGG